MFICGKNDITTTSCCQTNSILMYLFTEEFKLYVKIHHTNIVICGTDKIYGNEVLKFICRQLAEVINDLSIKIDVFGPFDHFILKQVKDIIQLKELLSAQISIKDLIRELISQNEDLIIYINLKFVEVYDTKILNFLNELIRIHEDLIKRLHSVLIVLNLR